MVQGVRCSICPPLFAEDQEARPSTPASLNTLLKRGESRNLSCPLKDTSSTQLGSRVEQTVADRQRQVMSEQAPIKEWIEDRSAKGATNDESANGAFSDESAKGANNNESNEGSGNKDNAHNAAPATEEPITNEGVKDSSQESSSASIADNNARAMTDLMWQEHPSIQVSSASSSAEQERLGAYKLLWKENYAEQAQKSAKTVFFEENAKCSSSK
jgi:hypothetical protein